MSTTDQVAAAKAEQSAAQTRAKLAVLAAAEHSPTAGELWNGLLPPRPFNEGDLSAALCDLLVSGHIMLGGDGRILLGDVAF